MKTKLTAAETETIIRISKADKEWDVSTADPSFVRYLQKRGYGDGEPMAQDGAYRHYLIPKARIRLLTKDKRPAPKHAFKSTTDVAVSVSNNRKA